MTKKILKLLLFIAAVAIDPFTLFLLSSVASAAVSAKNSSETAKRKNAAITLMLSNQDEFSRQSQEKITDTIQDFQPGQQKEDLAARDAENTAVLERLSTANQSQRENRPGISGKLSSAFEGESLQRKGATDAKSLARQLSLARFFGGKQRSLDAGKKLSGLQNFLGTIRGNRAGQARVDQQKINSVLPSGGLELLSGILKGVSLASGFAGGASGIPATTGTVSGLPLAPTPGIFSRLPNTGLGL